MPAQPQPVLLSNGTRAAAAPVEASARWQPVDDDLALGFECADPALQIERWGQEVLPLLQSRA